MMSWVLCYLALSVHDTHRFDNFTSALDSLKETAKEWFATGSSANATTKENPPENALQPVPLPAYTAPDPRARVSIDAGTLVGHFVFNQSVAEFLGIPYADAPVGSLRFASPRPYPGGLSEYHASQVRAGCPQRCKALRVDCPTAVSEDCLFANVWTPFITSPSGYAPNLPVYVFIHGGAFTGGHGGIYNGSRLAQQGMVVVSFNYRLGALGFLATKEMKGNYGFEDQQLLLHWVQRNIRSFGGDPSKVTIGGQSAGAQSVALHLVSSKSAGMFHRAIMQSPVLGYPHLNRSEHLDTVSRSFLNKLVVPCDKESLECLREAPVDSILEAQVQVQYPLLDPLQVIALPHFTTAAMPFAYVLDDDIPVHPLTAMQSHHWNRVPILSGFTRDETSGFVQGYLPQIGSWTYAALMQAAFRDRAGEVTEAYPAVSDKDQREELQEWSRDLLLACPLRNASHSFLEGHSYMYRFDHVYANDSVWMEYKDRCSKYACHCAELPAVFYGRDMYKQLAMEAPNQREADIAENLFRRFAAFIKTGDPNPPELNSQPRWLPTSVSSSGNSISNNATAMASTNGTVASSEGLRMFVFDQESSMQALPEMNRCDLWDRLGYQW